MKAEIYKAGAWREMAWEAGMGPSVTLEMEGNRLFEFKAPYVTLEIFDAEGKFRPDGEWEVTRGDEVRIWAGDNLVEVFRGGVDRDIEWDSRAGTVRFAALGYLAGLKDVKLGRRGRVQDPDTGATTQLERQRWVKRNFEQTARLDAAGGETVDDNGDVIMEDVEFEYVIWPHVFATLPAGERVGYKEEWIFNSLGGSFESEQALVKLGVMEEVKFGVYRRRLSRATGASFLLSEIAAEITAQVNEETAGHTLIWAPGEIEINETITVVDEYFADLDIFTREFDDAEQALAAGWAKPGNEDDAEYFKQAADSPLIIFRVENKTDGIKTEELSWTLTAAFLRERIEKLKGGFSGGAMGTLVNIETFHAARRARRVWNGGRFGQSIGERVIFWQIWSFKIRLSVTPPGGDTEPVERWSRGAATEWFIVNLKDGTTADHGFIIHIPRVGETVIEEPNLWRSVRLGLDWDYPDEGHLGGAVKYQGEFISVERTIFNEDDEDGSAWEMELDGNLYLNDGGVLKFTGDLAIERLKYDFRDGDAGEVLLELAKLTNSVVHVGNDRTLYVVGRDYLSGTEHAAGADMILPGMVQTVADYWAERTPQISSSVIDSKEYLRALKGFYAESYFPLKEEVWRVGLLETEATAGIRLLDGLRLPWLGAGTAALRVRRVEIREGEVLVEAGRSRD